MTASSFFSVLFDVDELTCFTDTAKGTSVFPVFDYCGAVQFFSINPLDNKDNNPTEPYHAADKPRRADCNVVKYRNILIEMDSVPVNEQLALIKEYGIPFSTAVKSGGKSVHFIISLQEPVKTEKEYRQLTSAIYQAIKEADKSCKNPSRLSRFPNAYRSDKNARQELLYVGDRVPYQSLVEWLESRGVSLEEAPVYNTPTNYIVTGHLNGWTLNYLMFGSPQGERNSSLFKAACDYARNNFEFETALSRLKTRALQDGLSEAEIQQCVKSAYSRVRA